ncbi:Phenylacetate-coenzyme A ligase [Pirellula sp. SH-Sr6A]|uniref:phenylacetate--CoA ligase family protein n=1 Tax=Pirellula sp. SH-Sr6A TaxID=1632865 RepID=UPI00078D6327|nr:AMP-binding protein [Pirellula sp. SH-Sr6A]AMV31120.1 Phenylacetate-coenzyme A ligase [Pirellula sp. SH-Sr6A]
MTTRLPADPFRRSIQSVSREELQQYQLERLNQLLAKTLPFNRHYQERFGISHLQLESLEQWSQFPTSTKSEWQSDGIDGIARHHSHSPNRYRRYHRTSGTRGRPMVILDTAEDWDWWTSTWQYVLDACSINSDDRILMAFSFGPFIGFWSAHDACLQRECLVIPSGGLSTLARIDLIRTASPTVLFGTPSYALHLAQEAAQRGISLRESSIRTVFVAGEPGGSIPSVRAQLEELYGAQVMDHAGATEIGPWGFGTADGKGLHVIESEFIAEFLPLDSSITNADPRWRELVITSLGRAGAPVLRYRTQDIVQPVWDRDVSGTEFVRLEGGILGRADDMFVVRGVNVFPTAIESIIRQFPGIEEFRIRAQKRGELDEVAIDIESSEPLQTLLEEALQVQLGLRIPVVPLPIGSLPKSEGKSRRIVRS